MNHDFTTFYRLDSSEHESVVKSRQDAVEETGVFVKIAALLQEQQERIAALEQKNAVLEARIAQLETARSTDQNQENNMIMLGGRQWYIISTTERSMLVLSEKCVAVRPFVDKIVYTDPYIWHISSIRHWLNTEFYEQFSAEEKEKIMETYIESPGKFIPNSYDKVWLLSYEEAAAVPKKIRSLDKHWWWLRTCGNRPYQIAGVSYDGTINQSGYNVDNKYGGVRPALRILK